MVNVNINGVSYQIPNTGEEGWGDNVTNWIVAASSFLLQRSGGSFPLSAEVDLGAVAGLRALIYRSQASDVAASGVLRLGNADKISFRNAANSSDLQLGLSANSIQFNGINLIQAGIGSIVNADVNAAAAIALSKLAAVTASRALVSDGSGIISPSSVTSTELGYVSGVTSGIQAQIDALVVGAGINQLTGDVTAGPGSGSQAATISAGAVTNSKIANLAVDNAKVSATAAIAYSKLNLTSSVVAGDVNSAAAPNGALLTANGSGGATFVVNPVKARVVAKINVTSQVVAAAAVDTIQFGNELLDTTSSYNAGTYEFTAPATGIYIFSGFVNSTATISTFDRCSINIVRLGGTIADAINLKISDNNLVSAALYFPFELAVSLTVSDVITVAFGSPLGVGVTLVGNGVSGTGTLVIEQL